jgi:hypothetical protein
MTLAPPGRPGHLDPVDAAGTAEPEQQPRISLGDEAGTTALQAGQDAPGKADAHHRPEGVTAALPPLQGDAQEAGILADLVAEQEMGAAVHGAQEDVAIAVIVQIGVDGGAPVSHRIGAGHSGDVQEATVTQVEGDHVAL